MLYEKQITLKNGAAALLRSPLAEKDAPAMVQYLVDVAGETPYTLGYPEERRMPVEKEAAFLQHVAESPNDLFIVCEVEGRLAGNCHLSFNTKAKVAHRATVAIALYKEFWNLGIGTAMFEAMIAVARDRGVMQLELEFIEGNTRARALYEKMGFRLTGIQPNAVCLKDGTLLDMHMMVKRL